MNQATTNGRSPTVKTAVSNQNSPEMLSLLIENLKDYAIIMLDPQGMITSWTLAAERLKGYQPKEVLGKHFSIFYTPEDVARGKVGLEIEVATREGRFEDEGWRMRKDGSQFWANVVVTSITDGKGNILGFGKVTRDLSERKKSEDQIRQQSREILEMATVPVVQVWEGILLVPLIGVLDSERSQQLMERLLERITTTGSPVAIVDLTGVPAIDTKTAQHLVETIKAVRFVGADVVLTGVRPAIAQTLVHLGIDLSSVTTRSSLSAGLKMALAMTNLHVVAGEAVGS